ncbi:hypothetical protein GCM10018793_17100 [Streptomyces sulfonofaciens]|uniref:Transferase n=1 Tax=Streptomyces sulfonofaciens TaxID=68272 RepID=A0A919FZ08_9ACTN|nr:hypothetical protein [Streptomyces sulfonofaciens]GHH74961.1 hypothetical protein GCM10018793_17100 [Streptomyces sulfonofaciens]
MSTPSPAPAADREGTGAAGGPAAPVSGPRTAGTAEAESTPPRGDCTADATGRLSFRIAGPVPRRPADGPPHLLLRRRGKDPAEEVRLPLVPLDDGRLGASLDPGDALAEGRWDAYLEDADGARPPVAPGVHDLRALVDRDPAGGPGPVAVRIPYTTKGGDLAVRCWRRAPHAEAGELHITGGVLTVHGLLYGATPAPGAHGELRRRGTGHTVRAETATDGPRFTCTVPYRALADAAPPGIWDLWLRPAGEHGPRVRIARLLDDIADKKHIFTFPAVPVTGGRAPLAAQPYYTVDNDLAVRVEVAEGAEPSG